MMRQWQEGGEMLLGWFTYTRQRERDGRLPLRDEPTSERIKRQVGETDEDQVGTGRTDGRSDRDVCIERKGWEGHPSCWLEHMWSSTTGTIVYGPHTHTHRRLESYTHARVGITQRWIADGPLWLDGMFFSQFWSSLLFLARFPLFCWASTTCVCTKRRGPPIPTLLHVHIDAIRLSGVQY